MLSEHSDKNELHQSLMNQKSPRAALQAGTSPRSPSLTNKLTLNGKRHTIVDIKTVHGQPLPKPFRMKGKTTRNYGGTSKTPKKKEAAPCAVTEKSEMLKKLFNDRKKYQFPQLNMHEINEIEASVRSGFRSGFNNF